jgi:hypothetical protein
MAGLYTGATGLWGGFSGLLFGSTGLSTPPGLLADVSGTSPPIISNGILLENGTDFLMLEDGTSYILQEA